MTVNSPGHTREGSVLGEENSLEKDEQQPKRILSAKSKSSTSTKRIHSAKKSLSPERVNRLDVLKKIRDSKNTGGTRYSDYSCDRVDEKGENESVKHASQDSIDGLTTRDGDNEDYVQLSYSEFT